MLDRSPDIDDVDVSPATDVVVTFNGAVDPDTVDETSFTLDGGGAVSGTVSIDDTNMIATFAPDGCLASDTTFTVDTTSDIDPFDGEMYEFATASGWLGIDEDELDDQLTDANVVALASDGVGRTMALWLQEADGAGGDDLLAALFDVDGCGWSAPVVVDTAGPAAAAPSIGTGADGAFVATWQQADDLQFSVFDPFALTWAAPASVDPTAAPGSALLSTLSVNNLGEALAVWLEGPTVVAGGAGMAAVPADANVRASFFDPMEGIWTEAQTVNTTFDLVIDGLSADLDAAGNAIIMYEQNTLDDNLDGDGDATTGEEDEALFSQFNPFDDSWSAPVELDFDMSDVVDVIVTIEETTGDALLLWEQDEVVPAMGGVRELRAVVLFAGDDPAIEVPPVLSFSFDGNPGDVSAVVDSNTLDVFIVVQDPGTMGMAGAPNGVSTVKAIVFDGDTDTFGEPETIGLGIAADAATPMDLTAVDDVRLTFDAAGNPVAVWVVEEFVAGVDDNGDPISVFGDASTVVTNTFIDGVGWGIPTTPTDATALTTVVSETVESTGLEVVSGTELGEIIVRLRDDGADVDEVIGIRNGDNAN